MTFLRFHVPLGPIRRGHADETQESHQVYRWPRRSHLVCHPERRGTRERRVRVVTNLPRSVMLSHAGIILRVIPVRAQSSPLVRGYKRRGSSG